MPDLRATLAGQPLGYAVHPLADRVDATDAILSEDPYVPLSLGRRPVVLDPFMLLRLDQIDPGAVDVLIARIERRDFDFVVTIEPLDGSDTSDLTAAVGDVPTEGDSWWNHYHFGLRVVGAIRRNYLFEGVVDGYYVYRPLR